ncbi:ATP-binding protein [Candidatus Thiosymbion oneisti]|uniref:ATP-binding protein n=1 Tax=Candidatus Thiosymbion oneisti TaxID=589554 RepID=UPI00105F34EB|nr:ATP-binding protein [Candidatus Thiosymbion oneisti]
MVSNRTASGKLASILLAGCLILCLFAGARAADQPDPDPKPPKPPTSAEIAGYRAALEDPLDSVVIAARDIERAEIILAQPSVLPKELAQRQRVVELWMEEPTPAGIQTLAINAELAALLRPYARALTKLLIDRHPAVRDAAQALIKAQPALLDLPTETLADWLKSEGRENRAKRLGAIRAADLNPKLARAHARVLSKLLGDEDLNVRDATHALFKAQPALLDLSTKTLADWLKGRSLGQRVGAIWAADLDPELARPYARNLSKLLGDEENYVQDAAHALFEAQPGLLDLPTETLAAWLQSEDWTKRLGAIRAANLDPELARPYARNLSKLLGDEENYVQDAAHTLFKEQPELLDLPAETLADWLQSEDWTKRLSAIRAANLDPELAHAHARALSELLGDEDRYLDTREGAYGDAPKGSEVRDAAYELFEAQPGLLDLPTETLAAWLQSENEAKRLGAVRAANLDPKLARAHARDLSELLGDEDQYVDKWGRQQDSEVRDAAYELFEAQPGLLDLPPEILADWLQSEDGWKRLGAIWAAKLDPKLAHAHTRTLSELLGYGDPDVDMWERPGSEVQDAAYALFKEQPALLDLPAETLADWLQSKDEAKRRGAIWAANLDPKLARAHARTLSERLGDKDWRVQNAVYALFKEQPELLDLPAKTLTAWLQSDDEAKRLGAVRAATFDPKLARPHARALSKQLGDRGRNLYDNSYKVSDVSNAAHALFKEQPELLDLPTTTLAVWLQSGDKGTRLGAVWAADLDSALARLHARDLSELLGDEDSDVRDATQALFMEQPGLLDPSLVAQALLSPDSDRRRRMLNLVHLLDTPNLSGLPPLLEACHRKIDHGGELRLAAHLMGGGKSDWEDRLSWLGRPKPEQVESRLKEIRNDNQAAHQTLKMFAETWKATDDFSNTRRELADRIRRLVDIRQGKWNTRDKPLLEELKRGLQQAGFPTGDIDWAIIRIDPFVWLTISGKILAAHALFWALLILLYPWVRMVQALFFWNPWIRRIAGLGYVGLLLAWIPWLRRLLFAPFRVPLLADAALDTFKDDRYYPSSLARREQDGVESARSVVEAIPRIAGQIVLIGESGLGKTMFLRHLIHQARLITVYLPAWRCNKGVLAAIQTKLHGPARDPDYLRTLIYAGAVDLCIDGVNEVAPDTREQIRSFVEEHFKGNIIIGVQPIDWRLPATAQPWFLEPLTETQIEAFLLSRAPSDPSAAEGADYADRCRRFLAATLSEEQPAEERAANQRILSNPMDATVVSAMLARSERPDLFRLQQQWYDTMARDYAAKHAGTEFPLKVFAERIYQMRVDDESTLPETEFPAEVKALTDHKMAVVHQSSDGKGELVKQWSFRHDKIWDYFIVQAFRGADNERPKKYLGDARFRGVYFLLAQLIPLDAAERLREQLIQYAADTKDHSVSDDFIRLLRERQTPPAHTAPSDPPK